MLHIKDSEVYVYCFGCTLFNVVSFGYTFHCINHSLGHKLRNLESLIYSHYNLGFSFVFKWVSGNSVTTGGHCFSDHKDSENILGKSLAIVLKLIKIRR